MRDVLIHKIVLFFDATMADFKESRLYSSPGFNSSATLPSLPKKYYNELIIIKVNGPFFQTFCIEKKS